MSVLAVRWSVGWTTTTPEQWSSKTQDRLESQYQRTPTTSIVITHGLTIILFRLEIIDHNVPRGSHYVECTLIGEEDDRNVPPFKIIGIFAT